MSYKDREVAIETVTTVRSVFSPSALPNIVSWIAARKHDYYDGHATNWLFDELENNNFMQPDEDQRPIWTAGQTGGLPSYKFNGDQVVASAFELPSVYNLFLVASRNTGTLYSTDTTPAAAPMQSSSMVWAHASDASFSVQPFLVGAHIYLFRFDYVNGVFRLFVDGIQAGSHQGTTEKPGGNMVLGARTGNQDYFTGHISEVIVTGELSDDDTNLTGWYLSQVYGLPWSNIRY